MRPLRLALRLSLSPAAPRSGGRAAAPPRRRRRQVPSQLPRNVRPLHYTIAAAPDAANLRFTATAMIEIEVLEPTDTIVLNAAELDFARVTLDGGAEARVSTDAEAQTAQLPLLRAGSPPAATGSRSPIPARINTQAAGLFALDYQSEQGSRRALFTQFEAPDARRFFPGWDEPNFRTPYDLTVRVPAGQQAVSNMPEARRAPQATAAASSPSGPRRPCRAICSSSQSASSTGSPPSRRRRDRNRDPPRRGRDGPLGARQRGVGPPLVQ